MIRILLLSILTAMSLSNATWALEYTFAGRVTSVPAVFSSHFALNDLVTGRMSIMPEPFPSSPVEFYTVTNISANIGGDYPITSTAGVLRILDDFGGAVDAVLLDVTQFGGLTAASISGHAPDYFHFNLTYRNDELSSTQLLPHFIVGQLFDRSGLRFDVNDSLSVNFDLYDFSLVPEPAALFLAGLWCAPLAARIRGKRD